MLMLSNQLISAVSIQLIVMADMYISVEGCQGCTQLKQHGSVLSELKSYLKITVTKSEAAKDESPMIYIPVF